MPKSPISTGRGRPPRSEDRRLEIPEALARCVARRGPEATTPDVDALLDFFSLGGSVFGMPEHNRVFDSLLFAA